MADRWTEAEIPSLAGKVMVVTGANSGIGYEAARMLAEKQATVVLAVRDTAKGQQAKARILECFPQADVDVMLLDLARLASVRDFSQAFAEKYRSLDVLINNAGVMAPTYRTTGDGFELQFGTNHLGHFALTGCLLPFLLRTSGARVVTVSSLAHRSGHIHFDNLDGKRGYRRWAFYAQSKLANLLFAYELQRRLSRLGADVKSVACHPGFASTSLMNNGIFASANPLVRLLTNGINSLFAQSSYMGALPTVYAATNPSLSGGEFIGPRGGMRGYPGIVSSVARSHDLALAAHLWEVSEQLTGVHFADLQ
ncbi:oxidoreductase [Alicyclobacillus acidiphilus]|uniref:oxidoreductase n=1 Tax=Alicyclobacillus acidiphilus TaxID=182455 RepID=UPI000B1695A9|nr:oxidoreductase [Alicyclobacillus acidiphilus]